LRAQPALANLRKTSATTAHPPDLDCTPTMASIATKAVAGKPLIPHYISSHKVGVVVSAGKMSKAVRVRVAEQEWNKKFRKVC
jgi:hypothetical protein